MDKCLVKYNLLKLNQEEIENKNRPVSSMEIKTVMKNIFQKPRANGFTCKVYQKFGEELTYTYTTQSLPENFRGRITPKLILQYYHLPDTYVRQRCHTKKESYKQI